MISFPRAISRISARLHRLFMKDSTLTSSNMAGKRLFHYTTIETLALILANRTIRFSRADKVNDVEELNVVDYPGVKSAVYISCWTQSEEESIPLWEMYASHSKGVRIALPGNMFAGESLPYLYRDYIPMTNCLNFYYRVKKGDVMQWIPFIVGPIPVLYEINNEVSIVNSDELLIDKVGTVKSTSWRFEKEHRFILIPDALWDAESKIFRLNKEYLNEPGDDYIDVRISDEAINSIEVTIAPCADNSQELIIEALLKMHTINGIHRKSTLHGKVRHK